MSETVQFRLEQSLPELQDLVQKELFTQDEVRAIIKKRTEHEHALMRRTAKKSDFLRYIQYEMNLELLRQKRQKRSQKNGKKSISDYAGPKRIRNLFQRATSRFQDIGLWLQYIDYSKSQKSSKLTGKIFGEALQKFPSSAPLWILAAQYEYDNHFNITGARNLLLRSLRMNSEKRELWLEYAKLECLYISKIVERRRILGLDKAQEIMEDDGGFEDRRDEITLPTITQEDLQADGPRLDPLLISPLTDMSTNPALNGAVPKAIYSSAIASRPDDITLVVGFYETFSLFHSSLSFVDSVLDTVIQHLKEKFPGRGKTLFVEIKDHGRGIEATDEEFPAALRSMIKTASAVTELPTKERKECCEALSEYLDNLLRISELDKNMYKALEIFRARVERWQVIA